MPGSMMRKVKEGNIHAQFCLSLILLAIANDWTCTGVKILTNLFFGCKLAGKLTFFQMVLMCFGSPTADLEPDGGRIKE